MMNMQEKTTWTENENWNMVTEKEIPIEKLYLVADGLLGQITLGRWRAVSLVSYRESLK